MNFFCECTGLSRHRHEDDDKAEQVPMSVLMFGAVCLAVVILFGVLWGKNKKPEETNPQEVQQEAWAQMPHASLI